MALILAYFLILLLHFNPIFSNHAIYYNDTLIKIDYDQLLNHPFPSILFNQGENMVSLKPDSAIIRIPHPNFPTTMDEIIKSELNYNVITRNLGTFIQTQQDELIRLKRESSSTVFNSTVYHNYDEIITFAQELEKKFPNKVRYLSIGQTLEERNMPAVIISDDLSQQDKSILMIECGIHAREWISPASVMWIINHILGNEDEQELIEKFELHVLLTVNPDGYFRTWTTDRLWRKNTRISNLPTPSNSSKECKQGVDLNRNFNCSIFHCPPDPCVWSFCGDGPFSELESRAVRDHVLRYNERIVMYIATHSYSQVWMFPRGYNDESVQNYDELMRISSSGVSAMKKLSGSVYKNGKYISLMYESIGTSMDWVYDYAKINYSFTIELRDNGKYGFLLPSEYIEPTARELFDGIKAAVCEINEIKNQNGHDGGNRTSIYWAIAVFFLVITIIGFVFYRRRRQRRNLYNANLY